MTGAELARPCSAIAWELRAAWATGRRVSLSLDAEMVGPYCRLEGHVTEVAATDTFLRVDGLHVPLGCVLAVHHPSRLGDSTHSEGAWRGAARRRRPQDEQLWGIA